MQPSIGVRALGDKTNLLQRLLNSGYDVESIESDSEVIRTTLRRGRESVVVRIRRDEAADLFWLAKPL